MGTLRGTENICKMPAGRSIESKLRASMQTTDRSALRDHPLQPVDEQGEPLLRIDPVQFADKFNKRHFLVEHHLQGHPLFEIPRLLELAKEVADKWPDDLYYDSGVTNVGARWEMNTAFPVDEAIHNIESCGAWVDLKSAERNPEYGEVLDSCISDLLQVSRGQLKKKMRRTQMAIFITSPNRLSTYHIDSECNFLLQIRGRKEISVFNRYDREVLPEEEIERSWAADTNAAIYKPELQSHAEVVTLAPGIGVHIPVNAPHWVQNGSDISVSVAILYHWWNSAYANVYAANYLLRKKFHMTPTPPFRSKVLDAIKQPMGAAFLWARDFRHGPLRKY
jgi:hypothetical protein